MTILKERSKQVLSPPPLVQNDSLVEELYAQLDNPNATVQKEASTVLRQLSDPQSQSPAPSTASSTLKKSSRARFQERQARKQAEKDASHTPVDAAADARIIQETKDEENVIRHQCQILGVAMFEIPPDGHCLFSAIGDQLNLLNMIPRGDIPPYVVTRRAAADYIQSHPQEFIPFLPSPEGEDGEGATDSGGLMSPDQFKLYCHNIRDTGIWGGEPEIQALSKAFNIPIHVIQWSDPHIVVHSPQADSKNTGPVAMISYHRRMYGLGEHYNSLRPTKHSVTTIVKDIFS